MPRLQMTVARRWALVLACGPIGEMTALEWMERNRRTRR